MSESEENKANLMALKLRETYNKEHVRKFNALVYGAIGTGKTTLITTARKPILLDSFDPNGAETRAILPLIESGDVIVRDYGHDRWHKPIQYAKWAKETEELKRTGFLESIGTYALDSLTSFQRSMMYHILTLNKKGIKQELNMPSQTAYGVQLNTMIDIINDIMAFPCDVIITGHITTERDQVTLEEETRLLLSGQQSEVVPTEFMEKWITRVIRGQGGEYQHKLQVKNDGKYKAETRIGGGVFETFEDPDVKALLKKAGWDTSDKPKLIND